MILSFNISDVRLRSKNTAVVCQAIFLENARRKTHGCRMSGVKATRRIKRMPCFTTRVFATDPAFTG